MLLEKNPEALAEQYLLLTLTLEEAIKREDWAETRTLFERRSVVLEHLRALVLTPRARRIAERVEVLDSRLLDLLKSWKAAVANELYSGILAKRATGAYASSANTPVYFDGAG